MSQQQCMFSAQGTYSCPSASAKEGFFGGSPAWVDDGARAAAEKQAGSFPAAHEGWTADAREMFWAAKKGAVTKKHGEHTVVAEPHDAKKKTK